MRRSTTVVVCAALALGLAGGAAAAARDDSLPPVPEGQALAPEVVPGAGLSGVAGVQAARYRTLRASGTVGAATRFRLSLSGTGAVTLVYAAPGLGRFRALRLTSARWADHAVLLHGVGLLDGRRVRFAALAVDNGPAGDVFRIDWLHRASLGGTLSRGSLVVD